jgi:hypothetical protein
MELLDACLSNCLLLHIAKWKGRRKNKETKEKTKCIEKNKVEKEQTRRTNGKGKGSKEMKKRKDR